MKRLFMLFTSSLLLALPPTPAKAITGGQVDTGNNYPFVGLLASTG